MLDDVVVLASTHYKIKWKTGLMVESVPLVFQRCWVLILKDTAQPYQQLQQGESPVQVWQYRVDRKTTQESESNCKGGFLGSAREEEAVCTYVVIFFLLG